MSDVPVDATGWKWALRCHVDVYYDPLQLSLAIVNAVLVVRSCRMDRFNL